MNRRLLLLLLLSLLLPFVVIVWWVQPSLDDLSIPLLLRTGESSRPELFRHLMHTWNGRYTSNLLAVLSPYTWGSITGYRLLLMLQFPALYFALHYLIRSLLSPPNPQSINHPFPAPSAPLKPPKSSSSGPRTLASSRPRFLLPTSYFLLLTRPRLHLLAAAILLLYLHWLPDITESIYWLSGAMVYTWALIAQLLILGLMADTLEKPSTPKTILLALLLFLASGFNEIALAINLLLAIGYWLLARKNLLILTSTHKHISKSAHQHIIPFFIFHFPFLILTIAASIVLFSPGNAGRMWHFPQGGNLLTTISIAGLSTAKLLGVMAQNLPLLLTGFLLFPHLNSDALRPALRPLARLHPLWVAALGLLFLFACMVVPAWAMGINSPLRIYNYLGLFAMGFFFWFLFSLHAWLQEKASKQDFSQPRSFSSSHPRVLASSLLLLILLAMAADFHKQPTPFGDPVHPGTLYTYRGNLPRVTSDLFFRVRPYQQALEQREIFIHQQKTLGITSVTVPPLVNPPTSILFLDITPDPDHWINQLQAEWYGVEEMEVRDEK